MTYWKVYFDRDPDQRLSLQRFVSYALGKRYGLTPSKLVRDQSVSFERGAQEDFTEHPAKTLAFHHAFHALVPRRRHIAFAVLPTSREESLSAISVRAT